MDRVDKDFKDKVYDLVGKIPKGRVMSYGQVALLCGAPWAAREVGGIAHFGPPDLPWQRVVMKDGGLAKGYPGGLEGHKSALEAEAVAVSADYKVDIQKLLWNPSHDS